MYLTRVKLAIGASLVLVLVALLIALVFPDRRNMPLCHKQTLFEVENWFDLHDSGGLPNVGGRSAESLKQLDQEGDVDEWNHKYLYVPGLRKGDPGDLVLMYLKQPTRWKHHAAGPPSIFADLKWEIVPLDFAHTLGSKDVKLVAREIPDQGECSERVSPEEFRSRLKKTLQYLQDNNRPNWQTVIAENEKFLKSLGSE